MTDVQLRQKFLTGFEENISKGLYDEDDISKVNEDPRFVELFLKQNKGDLDKSLKSMNTSLKWRKSFGVKDITSSSFRPTLLSENVIFFCNKDKDGHRILHVQFSKMKKDAAYLDSIKKYLVWQMEKAFQTNIAQKIVVLMDMTEHPVIDNSFVKFVIHCFTIYFPCLLEYLLIVEPPWLLSPAIKGWLTSEQKDMVHMVSNRSSLVKYIAADQLFVHLGGLCEMLTFTTPCQSESRDPQLESSTEENLPLYQLSNQPSKRGINAFFTRQCSEETSHFQLPSHPETTCNEVQEVGILIGGGRLKEDQAKGTIHQVTLNPPDCIVFDGSNEFSDSVSPLTITNSTPLHVAYKIKTTSRNIFRVRPITGIIPPQGTKKISVILMAGKEVNANVDKFLVVLKAVKEGTTKEETNPGDLWKAAQTNPEELLEHKLTCKVTSPRDLLGLIPNGAFPTTKASNEDIIERLNQINRNQMVITILLVVILVRIFICPYYDI